MNTEQQKTIFAVIEAGEVYGKKGNTLELDWNVAKRIWKEVASIMGREASLKRTEKVRKEHARIGATKRWSYPQK